MRLLDSYGTNEETEIQKEQEEEGRAMHSVGKDLGKKLGLQI